MISQLTALPVLMGAPAGNGAAPAGSMFTTFITFGLIIAIFYFLIIRPQKRKEKQTKEMLSALKKGDKVVSIGGIRGTVLSVREATVVVKVDDTTRLEFSKGAIASVLNAQASPEPEEKPEEDSQEKAPAAPAAKAKKPSGKKGGGKAKGKAQKPAESQTPAESQEEIPEENEPDQDAQKQQKNS